MHQKQLLKWRRSVYLAIVDTALETLFESRKEIILSTLRVLISNVAFEYDENKKKQAQVISDTKSDHVMSLSAYFHGEQIRP